MNIAKKLQRNPAPHLGEFANYVNKSNYNAPNLLKWSDCPYDTPYAIGVNASAQSTHQLSAAYTQTNFAEDKTRKDIFNVVAPVTDFKSLPMIQTTSLNEAPVDGIGQHTTVGAVGKWDKTMLYNSVCEFVKQEQQNCSENISPNLSSSGTASESTNITLANHSKNSGFIEVSPSSASIVGVATLNRDALSTHSNGELKQQSNTSSSGSKKFPRCMQSPTVEEENLLTSERTHFCPIKQTYSDGYSFEIPSNLDEIQYTRSASGSLYLDADKYMEYNPICSNDDSSDDGSDDGLVLKFCVKQIEKCCQADANSIDQHYMANRFAAATKQRTTSNCTTTGILSPDIEMDYELRASFEHSTNEKDSMGNNLDMESWTMGEIKQKCLNNNNSHALWEHCSACECDIVSMPANRFLKDELSADGDEIMSDLKYMQNLYIGSDWEDDDGADEDDDSCQPLEPEIDCNDNDVSATEPDVFFYNVGKLLSDFLKPQTAKSFAHAFGHSNGNTVLEEIVLNDSAAKLAIPVIDSRVASIWATAATAKLDSGETKITDTNLGAQQSPCTATGFLISSTAADQYMDVTLNDNNNNDEIRNNNNISTKYVGGLWSNDNDSIWRGKDQQPTSTTQIAQQTNNNIWSTNCVNAISVAAANNFGPATIAATTTNTITTTNTPATSNATGTVAANNAILSWGEKQHWEHSYLEEIWKTDNENVVDILNSDVADKHCVLTPVMVQSEDTNYADISRSGGGGNGGGGGGGRGSRTDGSGGGGGGGSDDVTALTWFAAAHEHSYDLSNETLRQLKVAKKILSHEDGGTVVMASISSCDNNKQTKLNRYDRKRRHSASQNIANILDPFATAFLECDTVVGRKISSLYDVGCPKAAAALNVTTIITCNYWTTDADATAAASYFDNYNNKGMNSITTGTSVVNPSLILKNMSMASRPLTR